MRNEREKTKSIPLCFPLKIGGWGAPCDIKEARAIDQRELTFQRV